MITYITTIKEEKLINFQKYIKENNLSTVRFSGNPFKLFNNNYMVTITYGTEDSELVDLFFYNNQEKNNIVNKKSFFNYVRNKCNKLGKLFK